MKAKKSLGQNFLKSPAVIRKMIKIAKVTAIDTVLEIGPGKGALTEHLLQTGAKVIAIEKDADMIPILKGKFSEEIKTKQLALIHADIINIFTEQYPLIFSRMGLGEVVEHIPYKVVANIPYNITGEIIKMFLESAHQPLSMTLMVQKEVAQRIVAHNGKESILSISVKAYGTPTYIQKVPAILFKPKPKVDSAIIHISNISKNFFEQYGITEKQFFTVVKQGFAQKRKKLANNLKSTKKSHKQAMSPDDRYQAHTIEQDSTICDILKKIGVEPNIRAETLTIQQWGQLVQNILHTV